MSAKGQKRTLLDGAAAAHSKKTWTLIHDNSKRRQNRISVKEFCRVTDSAFLTSLKEQ
jgi:hypothetical protein